MSAQKDYPELFQMIAGYFHEDWPEYGGSLEGVVDLIKEDYLPDQMATAKRELDSAIEAWRDLPEPEIGEHIFRGLSCAYGYPQAGMTGIEFLKQVRGLLEA